MVRKTSTYQCQHCGARASKWAGQCPDCGGWNTLLETPGGRMAGSSRGYAGGRTSKVHAPDDVVSDAGSRIGTGIDELDRVLGGGMVAGAVVLIGGEPGIGKSTLLLQALTQLAAGGVSPALYVTGEESLGQVIARARRLSLPSEGLRLLAETEVEQIVALARAERPKVLVIDSVQTLYTESLQSAPGSVAQVREGAAQLVRFAKQSETALFLVGHVTKEGAIAGPRVLEHMVDTVLYFEAESGSRFRVVRAVKNRFGAANELGLFAMTEKGLKQVSNPSAIFLSRHEEPVPGSVVMVTREGTRPILVEVQALVDETTLSNPRRVALGLDQNRLAMLLAVLRRHAGISAADQDVFVNVVGGVRVTETASDLPVLLSVLSSLRSAPFPAEVVAFGEVGLAGEVRPVPNGEERLREARKHGYKRAVIAKANAPRHAIDGIEVTACARLEEALRVL